MIRVLLFIGNLRAGGKERQAVELLKVLSKSPDIQFQVVVMNQEVHYRDVFDLGIEIHYLVRKITQLRIFNDENDVMNLSVKDVNGDVIIVSQFTLFK